MILNNFNEILSCIDGDLIWKRSIGARSVVGEIAGSKRKDGYIKIQIYGKKYSAHQIIWIMTNGEIPIGMQIDHLNGVRDDNRLCNLRLVSRRQNNLNCKKRIDNKSGVTGVRFCKRDKLWHAEFSRKSLGYFKSFISACEARIIAEVSSGICTERHGT